MASRFLTDAERDRYSKYPSEIPEEDLIKFFTLPTPDLSIIPIKSKEYNRLALALQLCTLRYMGFIPSDLTLAPEPTLKYLSNQLKIEITSIKDYGKRIKTRNEHLNLVKNHLGFSRFSFQDREKLTLDLEKYALEKDKPSYLLHIAIESLYQSKIIRPGISTLEEIVSRAKENANQKVFELLSPMLDKQVKCFLDDLLIEDSALKYIPFNWLKRKALANTPDYLLETTEKLNYLEQHNVHQYILTMINPSRLKSMFIYAKKSTSQSLSKIRVIRRYPVLIAFVYQSYIDLCDLLIDIFDGCLTKAHDSSKKELDQYKKTIHRKTNTKAKLFKTLAQLILNEQIEDQKLRERIYKTIPKEDLEQALSDCEKLIRPDDDNYFDFLNKRYSYIRRFAPAFLKALNFKSNHTNSIIQGIAIINELNENNKRKLPEKTPIDFVPSKWKSYVQDKSGNLDRHFYELCLLSELQGTLKSGEIYLDKSIRYADPESYLLDKDSWKEIEQQICEQINLPLDAQSRLNIRVEEVQQRYKRVDKMLGNDGKVRMEGDQLIISPIEAMEEPESLKTLNRLINQRLPRIDLSDLLIEVDRWTNFSSFFDHAGGSHKLPENHLKQLYASIIAQGTNLGISRMAQIASVSYKLLSWTSDWYIREETLKKAIDSVTNYIYHLPLSHFWGNGSFSSSDAQIFQVSGKIRNAGYKSRALGPNELIEFYSWTSDQYSQYGNKVKPSRIRDSSYVLDAILENETELQIAEHTTDTAGYTYIIFALFDLLGMKFSPRIKDLRDQSLFRVDNTKFKSIESRIKGTIRLDFIVNHWEEFKRVAGSLKTGKVTASLYISKLQAYPRKNIITRVLQEYGKLIKTNFILEYLEDEQYRRHIHAQLNKGEALNGLRQFLSFANERIIRKKQLEEQTNHNSCLTLLADAVIAWNTVYMTAIIEQLIEEEYQIKEEDIARISPARYEHINPYGKLLFDIEKERNRIGLRPLRRD